MISLTIESLLSGYREARFTPVEIMRRVLDTAEAPDTRNVWISRRPRDVALEDAARLLQQDPAALPLYGVPFAIKDNIDLAGVPTTAACPAFSYMPRQSARVVQKLVEAGAIPIGKTNLDQFATGLVGTRSPHGEGRNAFDPTYISGGSSSGSAIAVASGIVSFALGTDTAGSGRVPAAFNNIVGLKPSCGLLSTRGVVPACRSLDCVSIFALTSEDALRVLTAAQGFDAQDEYSRDFRHVQAFAARPADAEVRIGIPRAEQLSFFGDSGYAALYEQAVSRLQELGWRTIDVDFQPFLDTAHLLYDGPWLAERYVAIASFMREHGSEMHPVTRAVIERGAAPTAADAFAAQYRLKALQRLTEPLWSSIDVLMTPTAGTIYTIEQVNADPIALNSNLGTYTNFVNLLDLAAVATPAGFRPDGLPFGVTFMAPRGSDRSLLRYADRFHRASVKRLGATAEAFSEGGPNSLLHDRQISADDTISVVVCGAHMRGLPLNHQLQDRRATFVRGTRTAAKYRFFALPGGPPQRPGLVRVAEGGAKIDVEVWAVPSEHFGSFVAGIPQPLGIGKVELEDGALLSGFLCEDVALEGAEDITALGNWREFLARTPS